MSIDSSTPDRSLIHRAYNRLVRPRLPRSEISVYAGVPVRNTPVLDRERVHAEYKAGFLDAIGETVVDGDRVCLVGFGRGVSTVYAVRAGASHVTAIDGATEMLAIGEETLEMTGHRGRVTTLHAIVGEAIDLYGDGDGADTVPPADLPTSDVLVLDCEGAELSILAGLEDPPQKAVVETHPPKGAADDAVRERMREAGYARINAREYEPDRPEKTVFVGWQ
ncbi:FkbM family methyltransferase [Halostella litorea]|uniref:FkbM family methyltransferase n=1 Tax=Halostella litorea TaxID=2528831 RepID=UPI0010932035|nr:FkbM family methyltransferase [Halostella litorea]